MKKLLLLYFLYSSLFSMFFDQSITPREQTQKKIEEETKEILNKDFNEKNIDILNEKYKQIKIFFNTNLFNIFKTLKNIPKNNSYFELNKNEDLFYFEKNKLNEKKITFNEIKVFFTSKIEEFIKKNKKFETQNQEFCIDFLTKIFLSWLDNNKKKILCLIIHLIMMIKNTKVI